MSKVAIVVLTDTETHESLGRIVNALEFAKEIGETGGDARIVFDGAGTTWIPKLEDEDHDVHELYQAVKGHIDGACKFCAKAFGVIKEVSKTDIPLLADYDQHPSLAGYVNEGYQVVTF